MHPSRSRRAVVRRRGRRQAPAALLALTREERSGLASMYADELRRGWIPTQRDLLAGVALLRRVRLDAPADDHADATGSPALA